MRQSTRCCISCGEPTHPEERWSLALSRSLWQLSIVDERDQTLVGFIRATSDLALNANLWNLAACPGDDQNALLNALVASRPCTLKKRIARMQHLDLRTRNCT